MLRRLTLAAALVLLAAPAVIAQEPAPFGPSPGAVAAEGIERTIGSLFVANQNLSAQLQQANAKVIDLQKQVSELKAKVPPEAAPPAAK